MVTVNSFVHCFNSIEVLTAVIRIVNHHVVLLGPLFFLEGLQEAVATVFVHVSVSGEISHDPVNRFFVLGTVFLLRGSQLWEAGISPSNFPSQRQNVVRGLRSEWLFYK